MMKIELLCLWLLCSVTRNTPEMAQTDAGEAVDLLSAAIKSIRSYDVETKLTRRWLLKWERIESSGPDGEAKKLLTPRRLAPGEPTTVETARFRQICQRGMRRAERHSPDDSFAEYVSTSNGEQLRAYVAPNMTGTIGSPEDTDVLVPQGEYLETFYTYAGQPLVEAIFRPRREVSARSQNGCLVLEALPEPSSQIAFPELGFRVWMDPDHGMMPKAIESYRRIDDPDNSGAQREILYKTVTVEEFAEVAPGVWVPTMYKYRDRVWQPPLAGEVNVEAVTVVDAENSRWNLDVPDDAFLLSFPPGTTVTDFLRNVSFVVGDNNPSQHIEDLLENARHVIDVNDPASYEMRSRSLSLFLLSAFVVLLCGLIVILAARRGYRR